MQRSQLTRLKELEKENHRLRRAVSDLTHPADGVPKLWTDQRGTPGGGNMSTARSAGPVLSVLLYCTWQAFADAHLSARWTCEKTRMQNGGCWLTVCEEPEAFLESPKK
jgi:hypothetical protein